MTADLLLLYDDLMLEHDPGPGHPERPQRLEAIVERLRRDPPLGATWARPQPAPRAIVERVHPPSYLDRLETIRGRRVALEPDTITSPASLDAAYLAAGAAVDAVTAVVEGSARRAWALVRPPGHHAEAEVAMGFCLLNNMAIAAAHAVAALGCTRVLIVDWDVHHGNGTQHLFEHRDDILFFSSHGNYNYPGTGRADEHGTGAGLGYTVNCPLPPGVGDAEQVALYHALLPPIAEAFGPDLVLVSAGFDPHRRDPIGGMTMTADGFAVLCGLVRDLADRHAGGRLVLLLEGGYDLEGLAESVRRCAEVLQGGPVPEVSPPDARAQALVGALRDEAARFWPVLAG